MLHPEPYPYLEHIMYEYRFPNENRIERWPLDQARYPNSAESNSPPLVWESAGSIFCGMAKKSRLKIFEIWLLLHGLLSKIQTKFQKP